MRAGRARATSAPSARLYERYARVVHGLLLARVPRADVDDLVQDVFLTAWHRLDDAARPGGVRRLAGDDCAQPRDRFPPPRRRTTSSCRRTSAARDATAARAEAHARFSTLIRTLPEAYRETLVLRLVEGLTGPEIAERTGLTAASVRVNLHRGMKLLREKTATHDRPNAPIICGTVRGEPDPDVVRLEQVLGTLRRTPPLPALPPRAVESCRTAIAASGSASRR